MKKPRKKISTKYPLATVIPYGPDDKTVTKIVVSIIPNAQSDVLDIERWSGTTVSSDEKVAREMYAYMRRYGVKTVVTATAIIGCPHEEKKDFPAGEDCPFCPFWKGMQGSGADDDLRWQNQTTQRIERLGFSYQFWLPG